MAIRRNILERKHIGKIEAIPAAVSLDFSNAFAPKRLWQMAIPNCRFKVESFGTPEAESVAYRGPDVNHFSVLFSTAGNMFILGVSRVAQDMPGINQLIICAPATRK